MGIRYRKPMQMNQVTVAAIPDMLLIVTVWGDDELAPGEVAGGGGAAGAGHGVDVDAGLGHREELEPVEQAGGGVPERARAGVGAEERGGGGLVGGDDRGGQGRGL